MESKKPYSEREKVLLASLIREHGSSIENKKTDGSSIQEKQKAWERITELYNVQPESNGYRSSKQLKKLWDNLKQRKRKDVTAEKHFRLVTGGGPQEEMPVDPVMDLIDVAAPYMDVDLECEWDSTAIYEHNYAASTSTAASTLAASTSTAANTLAASTIVGGWSTAGSTLAGSPSTAAPTVGGWSTAGSTLAASSTAAAIVGGSNTTRSTPTASTPTSKTQRKRTRTLSSLEEERDWRIMKAKESVLQQRELHKLRMQTAKAEAELALLKLETYKDLNNL